MTYTEFQKQNNLSDIYKIVGDGFLLDEILSAIKTKLNIASEYDITHFDSENFSVSALIESCEQVSFFNTNRLVIVKNIAKINENDKKTLNSYIKNKNKSCFVVFVDNNNNNIFSFLDCEEITLKLTDFELENFVKEKVSKHNKAISNEAKRLLIEYTNKDINKINMELEKLCAYKNVDDEITESDVNLLVHKDLETVVFELTTFLGQKNKSKAIFTLFNLITNGEDLNKLFALISNNFSRMFFAAVSKNMSNLELANKFNIKEFAVKKLRELTSNFSAKALKNITYEICEVEFMIKSGLMQAENALYYICEYILIA